MPLDPGETEIPFSDREIAEAVLEHRAVLGTSANTVSLIQEGACAGLRTDVLVIGGLAIASPDVPYLELAEAAAAVLGASILGVSIVSTQLGPVVWDVNAVPAFRDELESNGQAIGEALLDLLGQEGGSRQAAANGAVQLLLTGVPAGSAAVRREVTGDVVLSA
jgi:hypothetical protein